MHDKRRLLPIIAILAVTAAGCAKAESSADELAPPLGETEQALTCLPIDEHIPLPGWRNLATDYAAYIVGSDITSALNQALLDIGNDPTRPTLYIPPPPGGTPAWTLSSTITQPGAYSAKVVGADPATTIIRWTGPAGGDMFRLVDFAYSKFSRITLDGNNTARIAMQLLQSACYGSTNKSACGLPNPSPPGASMNWVELNDVVLENAQYGVVMGDYTFDDSDIAVGFASGITTVTTNVGNGVIRRSTFDHLSEQGLVWSNANALAWLVADSAFTNSHRAFQLNDGSVIAVNNYFAGNDLDARVRASTTQTFRGNTSVGSKAFLEVGGGAGVFEIDASGNYVQTSASSLYAIAFGAPNLTLFDNYLSVPAGAYGVRTTGSARVTHGGNSFTGAQPDLLHALWGSYAEIATGGENFGAGAPVPYAANLALASAVTPVAPATSAKTVTNAKTLWPTCNSSATHAEPASTLGSPPRPKGPSSIFPRATGTSRPLSTSPRASTSCCSATVSSPI